MSRLKLPLAVLFCLACTMSAKADPVIIPVPLNAPVFVSLSANPVLTIGPRTIDFTQSLNLEFINFMPLWHDVSTSFPNQTFRLTMGLRARDGLASLSSTIPLSPDPSFANTLPVFTVGTTDLILFDIIVSGYGTLFSITLTDMNGDTRVANFSTPIPEPATLLLLGTGLAGAAAYRRRKKNS